MLVGVEATAKSGAQLLKKCEKELNKIQVDFKASTQKVTDAIKGLNQ